MPPARARSGLTTAELTLPAHLDALTRMGAWVQDVAQSNGLSHRCTFRLDLILSEAVTNIIQHAYAPDEAGEIVVQIVCEPGQVIAQVEDGGSPFDPSALSAHQRPASLAEAPIGGLGLLLMRAYTAQWEYRRIGQKNQLRMVIACDG